jgi:hypothetical protein
MQVDAAGLTFGRHARVISQVACKYRQLRVAAHLDGWLKAPGLQLPPFKTYFGVLTGPLMTRKLGTLAAHFQKERLIGRDLLIREIGAFYDLVDFERLLAEYTQDSLE